MQRLRRTEQSAAKRMRNHDVVANFDANKRALLHSRIVDTLTQNCAERCENIWQLLG